MGVVRRGYASTGGAENYLKRFAAEAAAQGHECVLFTADWPRAAWPHGALVPLPAGSPTGFADALRRCEPRRFCDFLFSLERVWACDCYRAGDGVHRAWLAARARREPAWRSWLHRWQRRHRELLRLEERLFTPAATPLIITNSRRVKAEIAGLYPYPAEQIRVVYNGVPAPRFDPEARRRLREQTGLADRDYVALFVGSGWRRKGLAEAIGAVGRTRGKTHLVVLGRGNPRRCPPAPRVHYLGAAQPVGDWLAAADVFILPTWYDPFSNACLEALAAGLPVITTAANGVSEIMRDGVHGSVVDDPSDLAALADKIEFWRAAEQRRAAAVAARRLAAEVSMERNVRATLARFQTVQDRRSR
jgi:UDP-glucose:(heptosyl)LPS alpha-1,3-glucosyltransferase